MLERLTMRVWPLLVALCPGAGAAAPADPAAAAVVTLHYYERPPFYVGTPGGGVEGLVAGPALRAFAAAGIGYALAVTPPKRQIAIIEENRGPACMMGWLRTPEREKLGRFSAVLYQDRRPVGLARADNAALRGDGTLRAAFADPALRLLVKEGFSYGPKIDAAILAIHPSMQSTTAETANMLEMIVYRRADYFLLSREEADELIARSRFRRQDFRYVYFSDIQAGVERHLWCTKQVGEARMRRLDAAIAAAGKP